MDKKENIDEEEDGDIEEVDIDDGEKKTYIDEELRK